MTDILTKRTPIVEMHTFDDAFLLMDISVPEGLSNSVWKELGRQAKL